MPVKKLSAHRTSCPAASNCSHRCEPRKPAPPVMSTRLRKCTKWIPKRPWRAAPSWRGGPVLGVDGSIPSRRARPSPVQGVMAGTHVGRNAHFCRRRTGGNWARAEAGLARRRVRPPATSRRDPPDRARLRGRKVLSPRRPRVKQDRCGPLHRGRLEADQLVTPAWRKGGN